jgi:cardiolipin synthase A/B
MRWLRPYFFAGLMLCLGAPAGFKVFGAQPPARQQSLDEWRVLTAASNNPPRVFVKGDNVRFYFPQPNRWIRFSSDWSPLRVPTKGYRVHSALLHLDNALPPDPDHLHGWREATVISRSQWRLLVTSFINDLAPARAGHAIYYQAFLADGLVYRDQAGHVRFLPLSEKPENLVVDRHYSMEETLQLLAARIESELARLYPRRDLFCILTANADRFIQPLLLDRAHKRCVFLSPAALFDRTDIGLSLTGTAQGIGTLLLESHLWAIVKNPISSAARLGDLAVATAVRFLRWPTPRLHTELPPPAKTPGMDLAKWEAWLDSYTGTRRQPGTLSLIIDGDVFYARLQKALAEARRSIHMNLYIFDRDDVAVDVARQLKARSAELDIKIILDQLGSTAAGMSPPATPMPEDFVAPPSISRFLREGSEVRVRPFLNPWLSTDHQKIFLIDGQRAWIGGMNIGREYRYEWHDAMVQVEGPAVTALENEFRRQWAHEGPLGDLGYAATLLSGPEELPPPGRHTTAVRWLPTRTAWKPFDTAIMGAMRQARRYLYVENPYLFDKKVLAHLARARRRGVDVRVILPRVNDFKAGGRSNLVAANYLRAHGVRVFFYPGMTHVKAFLADDWACLGSGNLNHLSLRLCQEQNLATSDPDLVGAVKKALFAEDFARSYELQEPILVDWVDFLADTILQNF